MTNQRAGVARTGTYVKGKNGYEYQGPPLYGRGEGRHWRPQAVDTGRPFHTATSYNADMGEKAISRAVTASPFKINTRDLTSRSFGYVNDKFTEVVDSTPVGGAGGASSTHGLKAPRFQSFNLNEDKTCFQIEPWFGLELAPLHPG